MTAKPEPSEAAPYYFIYIDKVPRGDICQILEAQRGETIALLRGISEERSLYRYAPDKWTVRAVLSHINDAERLFVFRAFWFARGFDSPLPSFEQETATAAARADERPLASHIEEFESVRAATLSFFQSLSELAWMRQGVASGYPFSVRALAYITAGHVVHHAAILRERYLSQLHGGDE
jgi:DinB superfamily